MQSDHTFSELDKELHDKQFRDNLVELDQTAMQEEALQEQLQNEALQNELFSRVETMLDKDIGNYNSDIKDSNLYQHYSSEDYYNSPGMEEELQKKSTKAAEELEELKQGMDGDKASRLSEQFNDLTTNQKAFVGDSIEAKKQDIITTIIQAREDLQKETGRAITIEPGKQEEFIQEKKREYLKIIIDNAIDIPRRTFNRSQEMNDKAGLLGNRVTPLSGNVGALSGINPLVNSMVERSIVPPHEVTKENNERYNSRYETTDIDNEDVQVPVSQNGNDLRETEQRR